MKNFYLLLYVFLSFVNIANSQNVTILPNGITPLISGGSSIETKSYFDILSIPSPNKGKVVFDSTFNCLRFFNGQRWPSTTGVPDGFSNVGYYAGLQSTGNVSVADMAVDADGNSIVLGNFTGTLSNAAGSFPLTSGFYIAKYTKKGDFVWLKTVATGGRRVAVDNAGNIIVTGNINGTVNFNGISTTASIFSTEFFVAKYNNAGDIQWVNSYGSPTGDDKTESLKVAANGNIILAGGFSLTMTMGSFTLSSVGSYDGFVATLSPSGSVATAIRCGGTGFDIIRGVDIDVSGNVFASGDFTGSASFGAFSLTSISSNAMFLTKINTANTWEWAIKADALTISGGDIEIDEEGSLYVVGSFSGTATFYTPAYPSFTTTAIGNSDGYIAKYTNLGAFIWGYPTGGRFNEDAFRIILGYDKTVWLSASTSGGISMGGMSNTYLGVYKNLVKLSYSGTVLETKGFIGKGLGLATNLKQNCAFAFGYTGTIFIGNKKVIGLGNQNVAICFLD
jgi:hypothetical protein